MYIFELGRLNAKTWKTPIYPIIISSVCHLWRTVATTTTPRLWNSLVISPGRSLELASLFLERSGEVLLNVLFFVEPGHRNSSTTAQTHTTVLTRLNNTLFSTIRSRARPASHATPLDFLELLIRCSNRWEHLELVGGNSDDNQISTLMVVDELRRVHSPNLRTFEIWASGLDLPAMFQGGAPKLSSFSVGNINHLAIQSSSFTITKLVMIKSGWSMEPEEFADFLRSFQNVQEVSLVGSGPPYSGDLISLPSLVALAVTDGQGTGRTEIAHHIRAPLLRVLKVSGWFGETGYTTPGWAPPETLITSSAFPLGVSPNAYKNVKHLVVYSTSSKIDNTIFKILRGDYHECFDSLQTLTVVPRSADEYRLDIIQINPELEWLESRLGTIRLVTDPRKSTELEEWLTRTGVRIEKLSNSVNYSDISNYIDR